MLPEEILQPLHLGEGDDIHLTAVADGSLRITLDRPGLKDVMKVADEGMSRWPGKMGLSISHRDQEL
ncbi:MAG: AbrB family transcriptional regulator [Verrucomicrobiota bacterium]